jgi:MoxR-like ATPase
MIISTDTPATAPRLGVAESHALMAGVTRAASTVILGKESVVRLALTCLIARGHLLIEDLPGVGKTTLSHVLANTLGLSFQRIQFTSDLLPADILGVSVFSRDLGAFDFHPGPIFSQLILADEVNRATPRTQSALLEAMEERQVTIDGKSRPLPNPFFVIATQNPSHHAGTFPLPESQLDRFNMCLQVGYPDSKAERELLRGRDRRDLLGEIPPVLTVEQLTAIQAAAERVTTADALLDYLQDLLEFSRVSSDYAPGLSPRAGLAILRSARAWALLQGRDHVLPEDIQTVLPGVVNHRLNQVGGGADSASPAAALIEQVPVP